MNNDDNESDEVDFTGGSQDWILEVQDYLTKENIPYLLMTAKNRDHVNLHAGVSDDSAQLFMDALQDPDFIEYIRSVIQ